MRIVKVPEVSQKNIEALETVRFSLPGVCLVLPLSELAPTVGADEALWVELVPHSRDHSALCSKKEVISCQDLLLIFFSIKISS